MFEQMKLNPPSGWASKIYMCGEIFKKRCLCSDESASVVLQHHCWFCKNQKWFITFFYILDENEIVYCINHLCDVRFKLLQIKAPGLYFRWDFPIKLNPEWIKMTDLFVFKASFNNDSVILWLSDLLAEETGVLGVIHRLDSGHWQILQWGGHWLIA